MNQNEPPAPLDAPANINRQIIATAEHLRRMAEHATTGGKTPAALRATAELRSLLELRLRIAGVLQSGPGRPKKAPGRPAAEPDPGAADTALYEVAAQLRAAVLELPAASRTGAAAVLADAFPALLAEPREVEKLRPETPPHLKPPAWVPSHWKRQEWGR